MAGKLTLDQIQIGNNATSTNNFVLQTFNDGTAKLQRGNIGGTLADVLNVGADNKVSLSAPNLLTLGTAQNTTSGTSIDFTSIPSWVKRITMMLNGVSTNGTSLIQVQIGAGSVVTSGYNSACSRIAGAAANVATSSTAFITAFVNAVADTQSGIVVLDLMGGNIWTMSSNIVSTTYNAVQTSAGLLALGGTLDRIRLTTANGTDVFDSGSVNIMYEG